MKQPIVLESNQNHATITNSGICPTLPASMGAGGGYVPMVAYENENVLYRKRADPPVESVEQGRSIECNA